LILDLPSLVLVLCRYDIPGEPFTWVSIAVVVVCSTVCASAPVKMPDMDTTGGVISGYWAIGRLIIDINPTATITIDITIAVTGLLINTSAIIILSLEAYLNLDKGYLPYAGKK
jgi:hypothetical protein